MPNMRWRWPLRSTQAGSCTASTTVALDAASGAKIWATRLGTTVAEVCRKMGISEATFYNWKKKYGGLGVSELRRLKQLEEENARLKRMVADLSLDKQMLQEVVQKKL